MNVIETTKLKAALERLSLVVPKRGGVPVLQNLRWRVVDGTIELTATDLDNMVQVFIPLAATTSRDGLDLLIRADALCQALDSESVSTLEAGVQDRQFRVRAGNREIVLPCADPDDFPQVPTIGEKAAPQLLSSALKAALDKTLFCVSNEQSRYTLNALRLEIHNSVFRLVGTDGHRLSWVEGAAKNGSKPNVATLVFRSTARLLARLLARTGQGWIDFSTSPPGSGEEFNLFRLPDGVRLIGRRPQGQFPNYEAVMPRAPLEATILFRRTELLEGLEKLWPVARKEQNHATVFEFPKGRTVIKAEADGTHATAELSQTQVSGKARTMGFNHTYLTQYVKSVETEKVSMRLFPQSIAEVVLFDSFRYRHLLMPLRV